MWYIHATRNSQAFCHGEDVTAVSTQSGLVASRYAAALMDMAQKDGVDARVERDLEDLAAMLASSPDLRLLATNPLSSRDSQKTAVTALAEKAKFQKLTANFLGVLAANRRLAMLDSVIKAFRVEAARRRGERTAKVQTAYALTPEQTKALQEQLGKAMGSHVTLDVEINRDLLGGMVVTVGSKQIDSSVRSKLDRLKRAMGAGKAA